MNDADWLRKKFRGKVQAGCLSLPLLLVLAWLLARADVGAAMGYVRGSQEVQMSATDEKSGDRGPVLPEPPARDRAILRDPGTLFLETGEYVPAPAPERSDSGARESVFAPTVTPASLRPSSSFGAAEGPGRG